MSVSRKRWAAIAAAVAVAAGGGVVAYVASADGGTASSFVPITPCRLIDTRATSPVGPRATPILAGESLTVQVTGSNGSCVIPATATAIAINVTAVGPSAAGYLTLYPADVALPNASNLNFTAGQNPTPNLVTVSLSAGGAIKIFNESGTVNVLGDIAGYYEPAAGNEDAGAVCNVGGLDGVIINGFDHENNSSSKCFTSLVMTLAGSDIADYQDGQGNHARFSTPTDIAIDSAGNMFVVDSVKNIIRKITVTGVVTLFAGDPNAAGTGDGQGIAATFLDPWGIAIDAADNLYVSDRSGNRIRKITPSALVSTLAGTVVGDFLQPSGLAVDSAGNVYVADRGNHRIRMITPGGVVSTFAGSTEGFADDLDGGGDDAQFDSPTDVAVDSDDNIYVADRSNHAIRKITPDGTVTTLAGDGTLGSGDGTGAGARFNLPNAVAVDAHDNVFVSDTANARIRKITPAGLVTTVAGSTNGYVDGIGAEAMFSSPNGLAVDNAGTVYVVDAGNQRVRRIS